MLNGLQLASSLADIIIAEHNDELSEDYYKVSAESHDEWFDKQKHPYASENGELTKIGKNGQVIYYSKPAQRIAFKKKGKKMSPTAGEMNDAMKQSKQMASLSVKKEISRKEAIGKGYNVFISFQQEPAENKGFYRAKVSPYEVDMGESAGKYPSYTSGAYKEGKMGRVDKEIIKSIGKWAADNGIIAVVESTFK